MKLTKLNKYRLILFVEVVLVIFIISGLIWLFYTPS